MPVPSGGVRFELRVYFSIEILISIAWSYHRFLAQLPLSSALPNWCVFALELGTSWKSFNFQSAFFHSLIAGP